MAVELSRDAQRWLARLPHVANLVLVVLIGLAAARLFWLVWPAPDAAQKVVPAVTGAVSAQDDVAVDVDTIASAHLFGEQTAADAARADAEIINAPETRLDLVLTGIISDSQNGRSRALIENERNEQGSYAVGDTISTGVDLHAIYANRVILDRNGRFETLTLESEKNPEAIQRVAGGGAVSEALAADLGDVRAAILANPASARRYIRLQPERQNGNLVGYRIFPGPEKGLFKKAGLEPGELVIAINGQSLDNPAASLRLLSEVASADSVSFTLQRDGQQRTVTVNFE